MDHLVKLAHDARARVENGYYENTSPTRRPHVSLRRAVREARSNAIITEVKFSSPSQGAIRKAEPAGPIAASMVKGGACAVSVLTEPDSFNGGLASLLEVAGGTDVPIIMKDIIVSPRQLEAGARAGADAAVIISEVFSRHLGMVTLQELLRRARNLGLETLVESSGLGNFVMMKDLHPDLYGINNRDLSTLKVDLSRTENIISEAGEVDAPIVSESGINSPEEVRRLRKVGAQAFLVGTSIMKAGDIEAKVRELVSA